MRNNIRDFEFINGIGNFVGSEFSAAQAVKTDIPSVSILMIYAGILLASTSPSTV